MSTPKIQIELDHHSSELTPESKWVDSWLRLSDAAEKSGIPISVLYNRVKTGRFGTKGIDWKQEEGHKKPVFVSIQALAKQPRPAANSTVNRKTKAAKVARVVAPKSQPDGLAVHSAYCSGYLTAWIEMYARSYNLDPNQLAREITSAMGKEKK